MARACICGVVGCKRHGRRSTSSNQAAWGAEHQRRRQAMLRGIANGSIPAVCGRCGGGPRASDPWEAGHIEPVALGGRPDVRPEHRSCNRRHGAKLKQALKQQAIQERANARIEGTLSYLRYSFDVKTKG